ncbi:unnamed protein product, partial [marine sediment metagenome]
MIHKVLNTASEMIHKAHDGSKHTELVKAAYLVGGYVASGELDYNEALKHLQNEINAKGNVKDIEAAYRAIDAAMKEGMLKPCKSEHQSIVKSIVSQPAKITKPKITLGKKLNSKELLKRQISIGTSVTSDTIEAITVLEAFEGIKHSYKEMIEYLRESPPDEQAEVKKRLYYFTWSGTFSKRHKEGLIQHSGLIVLDIDYKGNEEILKDLSGLKKCIAKDEFTYAVFVSPSGNGLKVVMPIKPQ